jgi:mannose/fructose/N-acetylgalactosamine-specific phosphotransferase system component IIC
MLLASVAAIDPGFPWLALGLTALLAAILTLDETAVAQTWFSQPLPAGILAGLIWSEPALGLALGLILQFLAVGNLPIGQPFTGEKLTPLLGLIAAAATMDWAVTTPFTITDPGTQRLGWLLVAAALGSLAGDRVVRWESRIHSRLMLTGLRGLRDGRYGQLDRAHQRCLLIAAARGALTMLIWGALAAWVWLPLFDGLPERLRTAMGFLPWLTPALAVGTLGELYGSRRGVMWLGGGFVLALAAAWTLTGASGS